MFRPADQIGPYTLVRERGRGTFGVVWLAERRTRLATTCTLRELLVCQRPMGAAEGVKSVTLSRGRSTFSRPAPAAAGPGPGFCAWWAGRTEPRESPHARPPAAAPCACPHEKAAAACCPRGWRCGPRGPVPACPRPMPLPGCTATGTG